MNRRLSLLLPILILAGGLADTALSEPLLVARDNTGIPMFLVVFPEASNGTFTGGLLDTGAPVSFVFNDNLRDFQLAGGVVRPLSPRYTGEQGGELQVNLKIFGQPTMFTARIQRQKMLNVKDIGAIVGMDQISRFPLLLDFAKGELLVGSDALAVADKFASNTCAARVAGTRIEVDVCGAEGCKTVALDTGTVGLDFVGFSRSAANSAQTARPMYGSVALCSPIETAYTFSCGGTTLALSHSEQCVPQKPGDVLPSINVLGMRTLIDKGLRLFIDVKGNRIGVF
jgi:hypothetical protein